MKGKITKDIFLRVGQGVMRIPRDIEKNAGNTPKKNSASPTSEKAEEAPKKKICK